MASAPKKTSAAAPVEPAVIESTAVETTPAATTVEAAVAAPMAAFADAAKEASKMFEAPTASITEIQTKVRTVIEKGIEETRANYSKAKGAVDEASNALEASYAHAKTGVSELNVKALEALRATAEANFDFVKSVIGVRSLADYVTLHSEFVRKQIEMLTGQTKELSTLAQKVATESVEPIKTQVAKTFKIAV